MLGTAIGTALGGIASSVIQGQYNKKEAQRNRDFQERMSNTAIQRQIADITNAGLSPAMLFGNSANGGAKSPGGSTASISRPDFDIGGIIGAIQRDRQLDHIEKMQDRKLDYLENVNDKKFDYLENKKEKNLDYKQRQYKDISRYYTNLDEIKL